MLVFLVILHTGLYFYPFAAKLETVITFSVQ